MADQVSSGQQRAGNYRPHEVLAAESHADRVEDKLNELGLSRLDREGPDTVGLVRFSWTGDKDAASVCDAVKAACREEWDGWKVQVSPNHLLGRDIDPESAVRAVSADMGGPGGPPRPTPHTLADRTVADAAGTGVTVGVIDTGIMGHPWLAGSYLATPGDFDELSEVRAGRLDAQDGHGTFVAGVILQQAPGATIRVLRVLNADGFAEVRDVAAAVKRLGEAGVDIINLSLGGYTRRNEHMMAFGPAFASLPPTTVVVAAAGNHEPGQKGFGPSRNFWPAAMPEVLAVAALEKGDDGEPRLAHFSNYGPWVDVSTIGTDVVSTFASFQDDQRVFSGWATWSGTSFATPRVSGAIAARMTDDQGVRVRSAVEAKRLLLAEAKGEPFSGKKLARNEDPGTGRVLDLPPAVKLR